MKILTQQEQALAQSQGGWLSPGGVGGVAGGDGGGGSDAKAVDIIQMLTKARTEYDKGHSKSEPKEIGGSSVLSGNPNLIKPIPVKPNAQETEGAEPKSLSLATLFGSHQQPQQPSKPQPVSPLAITSIGTGSPSTGKVTRPPVARTLTYEDTLNSGRGVTSKEGKAVSPGAVIGGQTLGEDGGNVVTHQEQPQHCPAIQKLMQGQRGVGGVLQTVSESPENRLCDNGVPLEHHLHHHHLLHHHQQHHHHHPSHQVQPDPIKRLFQTQPPLPPSAAPPPLCSHPPLTPLQQNPHLASQPVMMDSASWSHLQGQQSQPHFILPKTQPEGQHSSQSASSVPGTGLLPPQVTNDQVLQPPQALSAPMPGVVSPHELLQKLQLVQQEQSLTSHDSPRLGPGLAPRFMGPSQVQGAGPVVAPVLNPSTVTAGQKAALQFQVISPQRIPATVAPDMLLSPSVFTQPKSVSGLSGVAPSTLSRPPLQDETRILTRSQLQSTLLHLIQTDSSFLDTIYEAYASRCTKDSSTKY